MAQPRAITICCAICLVLFMGFGLAFSARAEETHPGENDGICFPKLSKGMRLSTPFPSSDFLKIDFNPDSLPSLEAMIPITPGVYPLVENPASESERNIAAEIFRFAALNQNLKEGNVVISPLSLYSLLAILLENDYGPTRDSLTTLLVKNPDYPRMIQSYLSALRPQLSRNEKHLHIATESALWHIPSIKLSDSFRRNSQRVYSLIINPTNPNGKEGLKEINKWVASATEGEIAEFLPQPLSGVQAILLNTLYFHSQWSKMYEFDQNPIKKGIFHSLGGEPQSAFYMTSRYIGNYAYRNKVHAISLDLQSSFRFNLYLPENNDDFLPIIENLNTTLLDYIEENGEPYIIELTLPRFQTTFSTNLIPPVLQLMGKESLTVDGVFADHPFPITDLLQNIRLSVDEYGVKGSAVSAAISLTSSGKEDNYKKIRLDFNRPFFYTITEKTTGTILFIGCVTTMEAFPSPTFEDPEHDRNWWDGKDSAWAFILE